VGNGGKITATVERLVPSKTSPTPTSCTLAPLTSRGGQTPTINLSPSDLAQYNGEDQNRPIYVGIDGEVFDVTSSKRMYGPGGAYHCL
jgi:hypothetical protein